MPFRTNHLQPGAESCRAITQSGFCEGYGFGPFIFDYYEDTDTVEVIEGSLPLNCLDGLVSSGQTLGNA